MAATWLRAIPVVLALALPGVASAGPRLVLRCDFCGAAPEKSPAMRQASLEPQAAVEPEVGPASPSYPAPPPELQEQAPVIVDVPTVESPRIILLEQRLRLVDASLRELNQTVPPGPVLMGIGAAGSLIIGGPTGLVGLILFAAPEALTAAIVLTTIGGVLTGMSVLLAILAYTSLSERREDSARLTDERRQIVEELERLRAGRAGALLSPAPQLLTLRF